MKEDNKNYPSKEPIKTHRFLDEAGDTTFFGKGKTLIIGTEGVSLGFYLGMVKFNSELEMVRNQVLVLQQSVVDDSYLNVIPSIKKKIDGGGYYFHATDDPPEVRERFLKFIKLLDCSVEVMVARKIPSLFAKKHNNQESEFYADVLSHLLKNKLRMGQKVILNISERGMSTRNTNLELALDKATERFRKTQVDSDISSEVVFNVQNHRTEPLLNIADYLCWVVQRVFERGEMRFFSFVKEKVKVVIDLYDASKYRKSMNYYRKENPLTSKNKLSPPSP